MVQINSAMKWLSHSAKKTGYMLDLPDCQVDEVIDLPSLAQSDRLGLWQVRQKTLSRLPFLCGVGIFFIIDLIDLIKVWPATALLAVAC